MSVFYLFLLFALLTSLLYAYPLLQLLIRLNQNEARLPDQKFEAFILSCGLILHAITLNHPTYHWSILGVGQAISLASWITVLFFTLYRSRLPLEGSQLFILLGAILGLWLGVLLPPSAQAQSFVGQASAAVIFHILIALFSYGLIALSCYFAALMLFVDKLLHQKRHLNILPHIPPLLTLEKLLFRTILSSFILLSLTIMSGVIFSEQMFGVPFTLTHKNVLSLLGWLLFAFLLFGHWRYGWRGKRAARWTVWSGAILFLAYLGSKTVLQFILQR